MRLNLGTILCLLSLLSSSTGKRYTKRRIAKDTEENTLHFTHFQHNQDGKYSSTKPIKPQMIHTVNDREMKSSKSSKSKHEHKCHHDKVRFL